MISIGVVFLVVSIIISMAGFAGIFNLYSKLDITMLYVATVLMILGVILVSLSMMVSS